jgi:hypothetical protein
LPVTAKRGRNKVGDIFDLLFTVYYLLLQYEIASAYKTGIAMTSFNRPLRYARGNQQGAFLDIFCVLGKCLKFSKEES